MSNKNRTQARTSRNNPNMTRAIFAAVLAQMAGTAVAIGQAQPGDATPETRPLPTQPFSAGVNDHKADKPAAGNGAPEENKLSADKVRVDENQIVDLHVNDEDLSNVLEMLSLQSQKNLVASKAVQARVTANLYGVTFFEALDAILNVNGFGYIQQGNFVYIYTDEELKKIKQGLQKKEAKAINLNYLNAIDAAEFVKPLLSPEGQIKTNGKTQAFPNPGTVPIGLDDFAGTATLVVIDFPENIHEIENLVKVIDTRPAQVLVEATILQTTLTEANAFGVDFSIIADMDFGDFVKLGGPLQAANAVIGGTGTAARDTVLPVDGKAGALSTNIGNTSGPGGLKVGIVHNDLAVFMRVLDEVTDTTILSNPKILALNRQASRVLVGRKVGYLSTTSTDTATTQTVEFLDTGTQLNFRPFVTNEGMVRMELKPQVSEAVIRDTNDSNGKTVTIPDEITNELVTNVLVGDGQTVVLGGLFREATSTTRRQIPFLGDVPIIGQAFRGNDDTTNRNEIIFLITPTIVNDTMLTGQGMNGKNYVERVRAGAREGVLCFSRDKMTSQLNVEAERLAEAGDTEKALWKIERSLSMNHAQPEAIALREKFSGKKANWPTRSYLERTIHGDAEKSLMGTNGKRADVSGASNFNLSAESADLNSNTTSNSNVAPSTAVNTTGNGNNSNNDDAFNEEARANSNTTTRSANANCTTGTSVAGVPNPDKAFNNTTPTTPTTPAFVVTAEATENGRLWVGRGGFLGGMWNFARSFGGKATTPNSALTEVKDQNADESK